MIIFADCVKDLRETRKSNIKVMRINDLMNRKVLPYEAPSITLLDIMSEGMLCQSFGGANQAGKTLEENDEYTWGF